MNRVTLAEFSFTATINAPVEKVDLPAWIFGMSDAEYQGCSPAQETCLAKSIGSNKEREHDSANYRFG